jgi:VWFA-related protein
MNRYFPFIFSVLVVSVAIAQDNSQPQLQPRLAEPNAPASANVAKQIFLDVDVTDKYGDPVRGLQKQDFTLLDDKQLHEILSFQAVDVAAAATTDSPVEVVLIIDAINAGFNAVANERDQVKKFLLQNGGKLPVPTSMMVFSDKGMEIQKTSTRDGNALATQFEAYETGLRTISHSMGLYGAEERFEKSLQTIHTLAAYESGRPGRKVMIWISPGWPLLSTPSIHLSDKDQEHFFNMIVAASAELRQARITLYAIDPLGLADFVRSKYYEDFVKGVKSSSHALPGNLGLQVLAVQTGGLVINSTNDLTTALAHCAANATSFYVLSFTPKRADQANEYHSLKVTIDKAGLTARTRTGYYNQP